MTSASSKDEDYGHEFHHGKKRRLQRACDGCRRKKSDGSQIPGEKCTACIENDLDCTYVEAPAKRPPPKSYVELETRLEHSDALVRQLRAELANVRAELNSAKADSSSSAARIIAGLDDPGVPTAALRIMRTTLKNLTAPPSNPHADDVLDIHISSKFDKLQVGSRGNAFMGKSSGAFLVNAALDLKPDPNRMPAQSHAENTTTKGPGTWSSRRLQYWTWKPWDDITPRRAPFSFPDDVLMRALVELYFTRQNVYLPLLHRQTFERYVAEGLHLRDNGFAATVLLVCAIGSRWSVDPSVAGTGLDCGWEWFDQVELSGNRSSLLGQATLYDLQRYSLAAQFLRSASLPQSYWTLIGVGLRLAYDLGLHRGKARAEVPSVEGELQKRAFWVLVYQDRVASCVLGRMSLVTYSEFDIDLPLEVDDEYWEHPTHPFQQPTNKPSRITFFNTLIRLNHILGFSTQILYSLKKVRTTFSINEAWEEQAITELDSALNNWRDQIPDHLRWDPMREDPVFFDQSVALFSSFYHLQITIHRPFILRRSALPSLTICTSAARACANVVDVQRQRNGSLPFPLHMNAVLTSGLVLMLYILSSKRSGLLLNPNREMGHVHKCMEFLRLCEGRWQTAGMLWDVLAELAAVGQLPLPKVVTPTEFNSQSIIKQSGEHTTGLCSGPSVSADDGWGFLLSSPSLRQTSDLSIPSAQFPAPYPATGSLFSEGVVTYPPFTQTSFTPPPAAVRPEDMFADIYTDPTQASNDLANMMNMMDDDVAGVWTNVPRGFGVDDWGAYFSSFVEMPREQERFSAPGIIHTEF
ncbi:fungal-specific transcription factor domain-containing protein [Mycena galopus ATCC 62051]|nr:fungal-specific transcription factor domain-containing protein [Mycena galopus ATCC 62051]